jgi:hypothetical protein
MADTYDMPEIQAPASRPGGRANDEGRGACAAENQSKDVKDCRDAKDIKDTKKEFKSAFFGPCGPCSPLCP